uniref:Uncharacterized protein n=1 Tax=Anguilla anguilla TaxID=7936 RepID=A0A0E9U2K3_ANGAN
MHTANQKARTSTLVPKRSLIYYISVELKGACDRITNIQKKKGTREQMFRLNAFISAFICH